MLSRSNKNSFLGEKKKLGLAVSCALIPLIMGSEPVYANENDRWQGKLSIELKAGSDREIATLDALVPLWQRPDRLLFGDVRLVDTSGSGIEGNLGLGFRKIEQNSQYFGGEWAWGVYGFLDRRKTPNDNYFSQTTVGAELFTDNWALRGNIYSPERDGHVVATSTTGLAGFNGITLNGTALVLEQSSGQQVLEAREYALPGVDVEVGRRFDLGDRQEFWLYGGYFNFDRSNSPEIAGPRVRAEYRQYDVFNIVGSEISIGAEVQQDDIRDNEEFITARLRIPFGGGGSKKRGHIFSNIERRITEYVVRDVDVVSFEQDINKPVGSEEGPELGAASTPLVSSTTPVEDLSGNPVDLIFVDATGGGTGTSTNRASADFAEINAGAGDVIVLVDNLAGNITATGGLQLKDNQRLVGFASGPATLTFDASNSNLSGSFQYQVTDPTGNGAATLTNAVGTGTKVITLADGNRMHDFSLTTTGAVDGIAGNDFTGTTINNIALTSAGADAFDFTNAKGTVAITNSSATNSTGSGLRISGGNATYALNNFDVSDTATGRSLDISATTGGSTTFDNNSAITNMGGSGVLVNNIGGNVIFNGGVTVNSAANNAVTTTNLNASAVSFNGSVDIDTSSGTGLTTSGGAVTFSDTTSIRASSSGTGISASFVSLAIASGAGTAEVISATGQGISLSSVTTGTGGVTFDNVSSGGGANGIALTNITAANGLTITSSTLTSNTTAGININGVTGTLNIAAANVDTAAAGTGVAIAGANGTLNIGMGGTGLDIDGGTTGVFINQTSGTINLGSGGSGVFAVDGTSGAGVTLAGAGTVNIGTSGGASSIGATTDTGGAAFQATGGSVNGNYAGSIALASNAGLVSVQGGHSGTLTFSGALSNTAATNATQLDFNNADGSYNFDGTVNANTSAGTGIGLNVAAASGGTVDFDNALTIATANGNAIQMAGSGNLDISGGSLDIDTTTGIGLTQSAGSVTLSDTTSIRASSTGTGINATGGTLAVASGTGTAEVISATGQGIALSGVTTGTGGVTFDNVSSGGGANGILLNNVTASNGLTITSATLTANTTAGINVNGVTGTATITAANIDTAAAGTGVAIAGVNGTLNIGSSGAGLDIDGGTTGVSINQTSGTVNLGTGANGVFVVDSTSGTGVTLAGAGTVNIGTGNVNASIGATTTTTGTAIAATGGTATFSYVGNITNTSGRLLDVQSTTGGSVTVTGTAITDNSGGTGIRVQNAAGNVAITNAALTQDNAASVTLNGNSGSFTMTNGSVTNTGAAGVAVQIDNTSGNINFTGTNLAQTNGRLIDIGVTTGSTAGSISFTGNLSGTTGTGIRVQNTAASISVAPVVTGTLNNSSTDAVTLTNNTGSFSLSNTNIFGTTGTGILATGTTGDLTFDTVRSDTNSGSGIALTDVSGTVNVLNGRIDSNTATGLLVNITDGSDANVTVSNNLFINDGLQVITNNAGTEVCLGATGNTFVSAGDPSEITLTETTGVLRVPAVANATALSVANGGVTVNTNGGVGYNEACTIP